MAQNPMRTIKIDPGDVADPGEVAQLFQITFAALEKVQETIGAASADMRTRLQNRALVLERALRAAEGEIRSVSKKTDVRISELRKLVNVLLDWRERMTKLETQESVEDAHARVDSVEIMLTGLEQTVRALEKKGGRPGPPGPIPAHEWKDTSIRFENPDGTWGEWTDLRGAPGAGGGFSFFGGGMGGVRRIRAGANITISGDEGEPTISASGGSGGAYTIDEPSGAVDDSNLDFVFSSKPDLISVNGMIFRENHGWSWDSGTNTATLDNPVGTGGDIFGLLP
jgi:hypothetical protein